MLLKSSGGLQKALLGLAFLGIGAMISDGILVPAIEGAHHCNRVPEHKYNTYKNRVLERGDARPLQQHCHGGSSAKPPILLACMPDGHNLERHADGIQPWIKNEKHVTVQYLCKQNGRDSATGHFCSRDGSISCPQSALSSLLSSFPESFDSTINITALSALPGVLQQNECVAMTTFQRG